MATSETSQPHDDDSIDLKAIVGTLVDHKWLILGTTLLFALISIAYAMFATPIYQADAVVQVEQKVPDLPGLSAISQTLGASSSEATTEIALIESRMVLGGAVRDLKLDIVVVPQRLPILGGFFARRFSPDQPGQVAAAKWGMSGYDWGGSDVEIIQLEVPRVYLGKTLTMIAGDAGRFVLEDDSSNRLLTGSVGQIVESKGFKILVSKMAANPGAKFDVERDLEQATVAQLQADINSAEQGKDSGIIGLTYQNADPELAKRVLNKVSALYVRQNVDRNSAQAANSLQFVKEQLPILRHQLDAAQDAMTKYQMTAHSVDVTLQTKSLLDQAVGLDTSIQDLHMQQVQADRLYTKDHPANKAIVQQLGQLEAKKAALEKEVGTLPDTQQQLLKLTRDVEVTNATYTGLLNQAQQLDIARAGTVGNVRIIDSAEVDTTSPIKPKKALIVLGGTILGALLAIGFVYVKQILSKGMEDPASIEQLGLPVYASIPLSLTEKATSVRGHGHRPGEAVLRRHQLLAVSDPADLAIEALRSLRTSLHFARLEAKNNLLMISGSSPSAGKTFVSGNLAAVIAQADQRVLLIDADMRKGALHQVIGGRPDNGLSELISGQIELNKAIRQVDGLENLHFIARGKVPPNPSELLMHERFTGLLQTLSSRYDLIIIDTPPILAVTDAAIIGHHVGTRLLVVRFGMNQSKEIALAKHRFEQNGVELKGAIFNAVEKRSSGYYSYGYYEYKSKDNA